MYQFCPMKPALLLSPLLYAPPLDWWIKAIAIKNVMFEMHEYFQKATLRNRILVLNSQGLQTLSIPIAGGRSHKQVVNSLEADASQKWQRQHWQSLYTNYKSAPFFDHYAQTLSLFYSQPISKLSNWLMAYHQWICSQLKLNLTVSLSTAYVSAASLSPEILDVRPAFKSSGNFTLSNANPYLQVFQQKHGFVSNVSILDLLFNEGPASLQWLLQQVNKQVVV